MNKIALKAVVNIFSLKHKSDLHKKLKVCHLVQKIYILFFVKFIKFCLSTLILETLHLVHYCQKIEIVSVPSCLTYVRVCCFEAYSGLSYLLGENIKVKRNWEILQAICLQSSLYSRTLSHMIYSLICHHSVSLLVLWF